MRGLLLGALALAAIPAFSRPVEVRIAVGEGTDSTTLENLCRLPGATLEVRTRSNMLGSETADALSHCPPHLVLLRPPLLPAHVERLRTLPRAEPLFDTALAPLPAWSDLSRLGPRRLHLRLAKPLDEATAAQLGRFRHAVVELDARGRLPDAEELARFRSLERLDRVLRIGPEFPPEAVPALGLLGLSELVVETKANRLPGPLTAALATAGVPVRARLTGGVTPEDLPAVGELERVRLEVVVGEPEGVPRGLRALLQLMGPQETVHRPDSGFLP